jgi:hypothetical protein
MPGSETQEILVEDLECYVAPIGTAFPALTAEPVAEWKKVGKRGKESHSEAGSTITIGKTVSSFMSAGTPHALKTWVTERSFEAAFEVADLTPETLALLYDNRTVEGTKEKSVNLDGGFESHEFAAILRGTSPLTEGKNLQFNVYSCYQGANLAPKFAPKGAPALLAVQLIATKATTAGWVKMVAE